MGEFTSEAEKTKASEDAKNAYQDAMEVATKDLVVTHPIRLGLALNFSVFHYEVLGNPDEACKMARTAFEDAIPSWTTCRRTATRTRHSSCSSCVTTSLFGRRTRRLRETDGVSAEGHPPFLHSMRHRVPLWHYTKFAVA